MTRRSAAALLGALTVLLTITATLCSAEVERGSSKGKVDLALTTAKLNKDEAQVRVVMRMRISKTEMKGMCQ